MGRLDVVVVRALDALAEHADQWNRLAYESPQQSPMLSWAWLSAYFEHRLLAGESWACVLAYDGDRLVGVLPLLVSPRRVLGLEHPVLRTPYDPHTISIEPLVAAGRAGEVVPVLVDAAARVLPGWSQLELERIPETSPVRAVLARGAAPFVFIEERRGVGAFLPVPPRFDEYRAGLSRNFRSNLNKARNKLRKLSDVQTTFLAGAEATAAHLPRLMAVEGAGWKGKAGTAIRESPDLIAFYTTLTRRLSQAGWLEWHFLEAEGKVLAGNLAVRLAHSLLVWKLGYDEAYARCSPGSLLFEDLIARACAAGDVDTIDLMTDWGWYDNWQMEKRETFDLYLYARRPSPLLLGYAPRRARAYLRASPSARAARDYLREAPAVRRARSYLEEAPAVRRARGYLQALRRSR